MGEPRHEPVRLPVARPAVANRLVAAVYLVMYLVGRVIVELLAPADFFSLMVASIAIIAVTTPLAYLAGHFIFPAEPESV